MSETETRIPAAPNALRVQIWLRIIVLAWLAMMLAFLASQIHWAVILGLTFALVFAGILALPSALLQAANGREPLLTLTPKGLIYRLQSGDLTPWDDVAEIDLETISQSQPDPLLPARRLPSEDRLKITLKPIGQARPIIIRPAYLSLELEALIAAIEAHSGRDVVRIERTTQHPGP
jgi:hypothetical protein